MCESVYIKAIVCAVAYMNATHNSQTYGVCLSMCLCVFVCFSRADALITSTRKLKVIYKIIE